MAVVKNAQLVIDTQQSGKSEIIGNIQQSLAAALAAQGEVVSVLERLLDELTEWTDYRALAHDVAEIQRQERKRQKQTQTMQSATLGRELKDLSSQQQADLQVCAAVSRNWPATLINCNSAWSRCTSVSASRLPRPQVRWPMQYNSHTERDRI